MGVINNGRIAMATTGNPMPKTPLTLPESTKASIIEAIIRKLYGSKVIKPIFVYKLHKLHLYHM